MLQDLGLVLRRLTITSRIRSAASLLDINGNSTAIAIVSDNDRDRIGS